MPATSTLSSAEFLKTLPGDDVRQILWRFQDRFDLQMLVQSVRGVARGPVARLVAQGGRLTHDWTPEKNSLLVEFDNAGITAAFMEPHEGGYIEGPKNLALSLIAFELAWVDGGAATASLATHLGLAPIHEKGTPEQQAYYMNIATPQPGRPPKRAAFALTEPIPYVGVETGILCGKVRIAEWPEGGEPILEVSKRGRFITNMGFANFVTAAVESDDPRLKGTMMVILHEDDPGIFDRGTPTRKLVHQLSSTADPVFQLRVPANRIIGGYKVVDGQVVPTYDHGNVIEAVFRRTRVGVGLMTSAKLLSAIEPLIRYHRDRFRGSGAVAPGSPRYELGLQQKEDVTHRLLDVWATGEAGSSLGFATARIFDSIDPVEKAKDKLFAEQGIGGGTTAMKALRKRIPDALEFIELNGKGELARQSARYAELAADPVVQFMIVDAEASVLCPATKLWNTGNGSRVMREAVSLMGGYGITEDCPGFLGYKWMDTQLEATYEGPEAVQRRQLSVTMTSEVFLAQFRQWTQEMRKVAAQAPGTGACTLASAMNLWAWTLDYLQHGKDASGQRLYQGTRQGVTFPMADALCWLVSSRCQILDVENLRKNADQLQDGAEGTIQFLTDLCHIQSAHAAGEVARICTELVYGYMLHPSWTRPEDCGNCFREEELQQIESIIPGSSSFVVDVRNDDGTHSRKAGPCVHATGLSDFTRLRNKLDGCLAGAMLAKDRAGESLQKVMIPAALDYPL
ncbi:acyl-CoA dehydrogenase family protein [Paludibaculum fermentans]|uniref:acyl-CoA dehydrogenase family protein n=1 Tax=Paludibaculum fermentans TaxID=1473598 RepID=UPI003EB9D46B